LRYKSAYDTEVA